MAPRTIPAMFERSVASFGSNVLLREKRGDAYQDTTYGEVRSAVHRCAAGFLSLGIAKGDRIALLSEGRNDWVVAELGMMYAGAVDVPLSVKIEEKAELQFRLAHSGCRIAVVSSSHAHKIFQARANLPELKLVIVFDGASEPQDQTMSFQDLLARGDGFLKTRRAEFEERWRSLSGGDPANICYTSGTTADPKGIVLTHRNYTANVEQASGLLKIESTFTTLLILPWDHSFAHIVMYLLMSRGASFASVQAGKTPAETLRNIPVNIKETRPTILLSVPSLAKNLRKNIEKGIRDKGPKVQKMFNEALEAAYQLNRDGFTRGKGASPLLRLKCLVYDWLLFRKVRAGFGGGLRYFIGGGALLDVDLQQFFYALGIPIYQGYGLTEAAPVISANTPLRHKLGSSGSVVPDLEIRICDDSGAGLPVGKQGEIVVRGENVMRGYWTNEKATRETVRDGWLHTGDLGYLDSDGFLYVLGRQKSLLIGHDGEKYSPEGIEESIVEHSVFIDQVVLYNNQSQCTVALVVPNRAAIASWLAEHGLEPGSPEGRDKALSLLEQEMDEYRQGGKHAGMFPERWLPAAYSVLEEPFTEQNQLLNSTLKVVRGRVFERYADRLAYLFTPEGKKPHNERNRAAIAP